jgi:hypothetical protein
MTLGVTSEKAPRNETRLPSRLAGSMPLSTLALTCSLSAVAAPAYSTWLTNWPN